MKSQVNQGDILQQRCRKLTFLYAGYAVLLLALAELWIHLWWWIWLLLSLRRSLKMNQRQLTKWWRMKTSRSLNLLLLLKKVRSRLKNLKSIQVRLIGLMEKRTRRKTIKGLRFSLKRLRRIRFRLSWTSQWALHDQVPNNLAMKCSLTFFILFNSQMRAINFSSTC